MVKGVFFSVGASVLFGVLYYYVSLFEPLTGREVLGWRILLTSPMVTLFILISKDWDRVCEIWHRVRAKPALVWVLIFNSTMLGLQFWIFMWAPMNGRGLEVSLGYFLLPLVLVFMGRFCYGEHLSGLKKLATICAALGVANEFYHVGTIAWETLVVALGFPAYFYSRRRFEMNHIGGLWYDMGLLLPLSIWFVVNGELSWDVLAQKPSLYLLIVFLGVLSATSWIFYVLANRILPFNLFGLLGYLEPILLVVASLILGERIGAEQWPTYVLIWFAILLLIIEGTGNWLKARERLKPT